MTDPGSPDRPLESLAAETLIERHSQAIATLDSEGRVVAWNRAAARLHGIEAAKICGMPYQTLIPGELISQFQTALGKLRHRRDVPAVITRRLHADGTVIPVEFTILALREPGAALQGFLCLAVDVSNRLAMEQELRRQAAHTQAIVQTVIDGIVTIDVNGNITAVNPRIETMFGYRGHELIGLNVKVLMPEPYHSEHDAYLRAYQESHQPKVIGIGREVTALRRNGEIFPMDLAVSEMLGEGEEGGFVGVLRDITERKAAEQALRSVNQKLRVKVAELAQALDKLKLTQTQLVESEKLASLGGLVAGVAHEINTPIGVCVTAASFLGDVIKQLRAELDGQAPRADKVQGALHGIADASDMLQRNLARAAELIRSFKQVAVDRSSNLRRRFYLRAFLDELLASLRPETRQTKHEITVVCDESLELDTLPGALSQVLTNLLQNTLIHAYAPGDVGQIRIEASVRGERLELHFSDDGHGIEPEHLGQIFEPFFTTRRGQGGTGLGLSVVYNLVKQALRGQIQVSSTPGEGTIFAVDIPLELGNE